MVTDDDGATNTTAVQKVTVSAAAAQDCTTSGASAICQLAVEQRSTVTITLVSRACELTNNNVFAQQPSRRQVINNACVKAAGSTYGITDPTSGAPIVFEAATTLSLELVQGTPDVGDPAVGPPHARMSGSASAGYVLNMDDGGNPTGAGEPDFDDIVLRVTFTPAP
jgi:hypothetical protein